MTRRPINRRTLALSVASATVLVLTWQVGRLAGQQAPSAGPPAGTGTAAPAPARGGASFRPPEPLDYDDHAGWAQIFDGRTLNGWDGNPLVWKIEDGAITAESTAERRVGTTYIIWRGGEV